MHTARDLKEIAEQLPDSFKSPLPEPLKKTLEYEFHSATYHLLIEVVMALIIIERYLIKELEKSENENNRSDLESKTALGFMLKLYTNLTEPKDVLHEIGVQDASSSHLECLADLHLTDTYDCLKLFFRWVDEGFYDFCAISFPFKVHLNSSDKSALEKLPMKWSGTMSDLMKELHQLVAVLKHSEQNITTQASDAINVRAMDTIRHVHAVIQL